MLINLLRFTYIIIVIILTLCIIYGKLFVFKKKEASFVSDFCAMLAIFLTLYIILSFACAVIMPTNFAKIVMILFGLSPFLLGIKATYHTEKYYIIMQLCLICTSAWYIWI